MHILVSCYTLISNNNLQCYPFISPLSSASGFNEEELENDHIKNRVSVVTMTKSFNSEKDKFPISQDELAYLMLYKNKLLNSNTF